MQTVMEWCETHGIAINRQKSQVLSLKVDRRTRQHRDQVLGIPVVSSAQYLGVKLDDDCSFRTELKSIKTQMTRLERKVNLITRFLPDQKYTVFKTLVESQHMHKLLIVSYF